MKYSCIYSSRDYSKQFDTLVEKGGAGNFIREEMLALENKYHKRNKEFPALMIPQP